MLVLDKGLYIFLRDGTIVHFDENNEEYRAWVKDTPKRGPKVPVIFCMRDGVAQMVHDSNKCTEMRMDECDEMDVPDEVS